MAIEGFDYETFASELSAQAGDLIPPGLQDFQRNYVISTIKNFATLCGEAIYNDEKVQFNAEQAMLITQIIAEWSFHKSVDLIKAGILPDYWDGVMQKVAFTIFEIAKQMILKGSPQEEILQVVEHHVKKSYQAALDDLKQRGVINDAVLDRASHQSNIDDMMNQIQEEKEELVRETESDQINHQENSKILKLASVALLLKRVSQDKVQTILNKFDPQDAKTVIQYMSMQDLEQKVDKGIAMKCLQEIKTNLPAPKFVSPAKILEKMKKVFEETPKEQISQIIIKERPQVKEFIKKAREGEFLKLPPKVANIIADHLEESVS